MNSCERQGWIASRCINCPPLLAFSPISPSHCKFSSKFSREKILTWQRLQWAGKPICRCAKLTNNNNAKVRCKAPNVGEAEFEEKVLKSDVPVLVDFVADWCGPCKLVAPFIDWASQEYKDRLRVFKIDHDCNPQLVEKYKVYGLPTLILFKDGQEVSGSRREGAITKEKLKVYLDRLLESVTAI